MLLLLVVVEPSFAQAADPTLKVGTRIISPFVVEEKGQLTGFSMDLWQGIAKEMGVESKLIVKPTLTALITDVKSGKLDLGISAISITAEREKQFDFTLPMFQSGLEILIRTNSSTGGGGFNLASIIFSAGFLQLVGITVLMILIPAHLIWWFERHREDSIFQHQSYFPGIFTAIWWSAGTLGAQVDDMPKGVLGRVVAILMMFTSVFFIAYFTATVTTSLTVQQLQGNIRGPEDLPGKRVGTTTGSSSATYLRQNKIQFNEYAQIDQAYRALQENKVDAVVFDAPVLLYYASNQGKGKVQVVGNIFRREDYGIVLPKNSPYRKRINEALLVLKENGTYQEFYNKWFAGE
jgi:polar amino acid transport system substrate-binding protein